MKQKRRNHSSSNIFDNNLISDLIQQIDIQSIDRICNWFRSIHCSSSIIYIYRKESKMKKTHLNIFQEKKMTMMMLWTKVLNENSIINAHTYTHKYTVSSSKINFNQEKTIELESVNQWLIETKYDQND